MSRPPALEPAWLVGLLNSWGSRREGRGWYRICPMLQSGIPSGSRSVEPTGYCRQDFKDLEAALATLETDDHMAVLRYFKPWAKAAIDREFIASPDTWLRRLRKSLVAIEKRLAPSLGK